MHNCSAKNLALNERKNIALEIVSNNKSISQSAVENNTSRKFIRNQKQQALNAIEKSFAKKEEDVLFFIPITKPWIYQMILSLTMFCKASYRNIINILHFMFDFKTSLGTIFNVINNASKNAEKINNQQDLSLINEAAIDEMFVANSPILTGVDLQSTYCFLLKDENDRTGTTWENNLAELKSQGLSPNKFITDLGTGLKFGLNAVYKDTPCHADVFHILFDLKKLAYYFKNRERSRKTYLAEALAKLEKTTDPQKIAEASDIILTAEQDFIKFKKLASNISTLVDWMAHDVLSIAGSNPEDRGKLYDFILAELKELELLHPHRIQQSRITLENNKSIILGFVDEMDVRFAKLSKDFDVNKQDLWSLCELHRCQRFSEKYSSRSMKIKNILGMKKYIVLMGLVGQIIKSTTRASSLVENLNSRIRPFCDIRKQMGENFAELLKFFINHTPLKSSRKKDRKNKTPAELLNNKSHPSWLEMLGFQKIDPIASI